MEPAPLWQAVTMGDDLVSEAQILSRSLCAPLGRRWMHVQGVARAAAAVRLAVPPGNRSPLVAAAWLHDIGYAPALARTGLHPLDGAGFLAAHGWPPTVVQLVAHHTGARFEAEERGLLRELDLFELPSEELLDALTTADLTVSPGGDPTDPEARISEALERYGSGHPVYRALMRSRPSLLSAVERTLLRLSAADRD